MRIALLCRLLLVVAASLVSGNALAGKRVALVIGNSDYQNVAKLPNPAADAAAIAALLRKAGFDQVEQRNDLGVRAFRSAMREFAYLARGAEMAVVFYAGHGIEVGGNNYLIPIDARLKTDLDIDDEVMPLDRVLRSLEAARTRLVILDACRDNPFLASMARLSSSRSIGRGLARIDPATSDMLVAFAAKAGSIAADGTGSNSPFTSALVKHVAEPGLDIRLALGKVRDDVLLTTHGRQEPFVYGSLGGATVAIAPGKAAPESKPVVAAPTDPAAAMRNDYEFAERVGSKEAWELFVGRYPTGFYADLARAHLAKLAAPTETPVPAPAAPAPAVVAMANPAPQPEAPGAAAAPPPVPKPSLVAAPTQPEPEMVVISPNPAPASAPAARPEPAVVAPAPASDDTRPSAQKSASLTTPIPSAGGEPSADTNSKSRVVEAIRSLQAELKRVGCDPGGDIGIWADGSKRALEKFNKYAGTQLMVNTASIEALETVKARKDRVCPLSCKAGYVAQGERCVRGGKRKS